MLPCVPVQRFLAIVTLRGGPEDLPYSARLLGLAVVLTAALNIPVIQQYSPEARPFLQIALMIGYNAAFVAAALALRGHSPRFMQTATALFGSDAIISLAALPILLIVGAPGEANATAALAFFVLLIWNIAVVNHILRSALSLAGALSFGVTLMYVFGASLFVRAVSGA